MATNTSELDSHLIIWPLWIPVVFSIQNFIGIPIALIGNVFIICGSLKSANIFSKSFGGVIILLIQALAICDLSLIFTKWITDTVTILTNKWIFGNFLCFLSGTFSHFLAILEFVLLASISAYKLYCLLKPFRCRQTITAPVARVWIVALVVGCALFRFSTLIWGMDSIYIENMLTCEPSDLHTQEKPWIEFAYATVVMFAIIPLTVILFSNLGIIVVASRHVVSNQQSNNSFMRLPSKSALVTVSSISWLFIISVTPVFVRIIIEKMGRGPLPNWYLVLQKQMFWLNVMLNPVCYSLSCKHFKDHLIGTLSCGDTEYNIFKKIHSSTALFKSPIPNTRAPHLVTNIQHTRAHISNCNLKRGFSALDLVSKRNKAQSPQSWRAIVRQSTLNNISSISGARSQITSHIAPIGGVVSPEIRSTGPSDFEERVSL